MRRNALRRTLAALPAAALLATGCGGVGPNAMSTGVTADELTAVAPTSSAMSLDVADQTGMDDALPTTSVAADASVLAPLMDKCHPHLFARTAEVVWRLNAVFYRHLRHVEHLLAKRPTLSAGSTGTWTETGRGQDVQRQLVITRSADGASYSIVLSLAPADQTPPQWTAVLTGTTSVTDTATGSDRAGQLVLDYDALHSVVPDEPITGKVTLTFDRLTDSTKPAPGTKRTTSISFTGFSFGPKDPRGPRQGSFTHVAEPHVGGSLAFQDSLVLLCPANPEKLVADVVTHARWYVAADGAIHGRADAKATGGQIPAADTWLGVTCYQGDRSVRPLATAETGYWAMKLEDATGATVADSAHQAGAPAACDAVFGAVPSQTSKDSDYGFPAQLQFPNEW